MEPGWLWAGEGATAAWPRVQGPGGEPQGNARVGRLGSKQAESTKGMRTSHKARRRRPRRAVLLPGAPGKTHRHTNQAAVGSELRPPLCTRKAEDFALAGNIAASPAAAQGPWLCVQQVTRPLPLPHAAFPERCPCSTANRTSDSA